MSNVIVVTVGPKVIGVAVPRKATDTVVTYGVLSADNAPWRKNYSADADFFEAMGDYAERESDRVSDYVGKIAAEKVAQKAKVIVVVSKSASAHDPKAKVYSKIAAVEDLLTGLDIIADETITVK